LGASAGVVTFASIEKFQQAVAEAKKSRKEDRAEFERAYKALYRSCGLDTDFKTLPTYEALKIYSCPEDEPRLKKLRERILCRNSDECFYDYQRVNNIIMFNRLISEAK
jgi:hypothetical protein